MNVLASIGRLICVLLLSLVTLPGILADDQFPVAAKPLFCDPVYNGAADPTVIYNPLAKKWWMFYTNRRANVPGLSGVAWVHGTPIGIAESADGGAHWSYLGQADISIPADLAGSQPTFWAPDVIRGTDYQWHMFITVVPGVFEDWKHPRTIVHLTSSDLKSWQRPEPLKLNSDRVIDPSLIQLDNGKWRLFYNDERAGKAIRLAESDNLTDWTDLGRIPTKRGAEGPKAFKWQGQYWLVVDEWRGLGVYRSDDATHWSPQPDNLLADPGTGPDDQVKGGHPDVVISGEHAYLFYFTHPGRRGVDEKKDTIEQRRSSIQVVELQLKDGWLTADRNAPTHIRLLPPPEK